MNDGVGHRIDINNSEKVGFSFLCGSSPSKVVGLDEGHGRRRRRAARRHRRCCHAPLLRAGLHPPRRGTHRYM